MTNIGIFASGSKDGGGSGARKFLERIESGDISGVNEVVVVSNHIQGGVFDIVSEYKQREHELPFNIRFHSIVNFPKRGEDGEFSAQDLETIKQIGVGIMKNYNLDYIFLSGWIKHVLGLPVEKVVNIHPGPTQEPYGGVGMYGGYVHKKIWEDYQAGKIQRTCITMHYVTDDVDRGPIICQIPVEINDCNSSEDVAKKVNAMEHKMQWKITKLVIDGDIYLDNDGVVHYPNDFSYKGETNLYHVN